MSSIADELDAMHAMAKEVFERGDFDAYRDLFSPDLKYRRADGKVVGRDDLLRDARAQFHRYRRTQSSIVRETLDVEGESATEIVTRTVSVIATAFFVVHRNFKYVVKGRFTWKQFEGRWRIEEIDVLEQRVRLGRFSFGLRARPEA
jgi:hypothetical protein